MGVEIVPPSGPVPAPAGIAQNGLVLYSTNQGDIMSVDPATGRTATVIGGPTFDEAPSVSPDGRLFFFGRRATGGGTDLWVANIDGTGAGMVVPGPVPPEWTWWAPDSRRIGTVPNGGGEAAIFDVETGERTAVAAPQPVVSLAWKSDDMLVLGMQQGGPQGPTTFATMNVDGSGLTLLPTAEHATYASSLSPDGTHLVYMTFGPTSATQGQIHLLDIATGEDTLRSPVDPNFVWENPVFSPDGRWIKVDRFDATDSPLRLALLPVEGDVKPVLLGDQQAKWEDGTSTVFSPDGTQLLAPYLAARDTYVFDIPSRKGSKVAWPDASTFVSWQRAAP
jgi:Tol biopolymer transport system component